MKRDLFAFASRLLVLTLLATLVPGGTQLPSLAPLRGLKVAAPSLGITTRVSVASDGTQGSWHSAFPSISADGRYVAFASDAGNLVPGDSNGLTDIFVHDLHSGQTSLVSVASDGTQGNGGSVWASISADGRYIVFASSSRNLVPGDSNGVWDIFVHDQQTGQTTVASVASDGTWGNDDSWYSPSISADGRYAAFSSEASNLVPHCGLHVHDRHTGQTTCVSVASDGTKANGGSETPSISADGRYVAFGSSADNLVPGDTNDDGDVFVHDRYTGQTTRVSVASDGAEGNKNSGGYPNHRSIAISADGRYAAFESDASNLVPGDTNGCTDIFVHDRHTGQTTRVSVASDGAEANGKSASLSISADGRYVAFGSSADNLVPGDTNGESDIFVYDQNSHTTQLISLTEDGSPANGTSIEPGISADGRWIVFASEASNLVPGDTNGVWDIFVHDRGAVPHFISGRVTDSSNNPMPDVLISTGGWGAGITAARGIYTITNLIAGTYTITPSLSGWTFIPRTRTVALPPNTTGQDFEGMLTPDLTVDHIDVAQVLLSDAVPLVAEKPTMVRIYVGVSDADSVPGVTARLHVQDAQGQAHTLDRTYDGKPITAKENPNPHDLKDTLNFLPPVNWLAGDVTIWAEVDPANQIEESDESNNVGDAVHQLFEPGKKLHIAWVAMRYELPSSPPTLVYPDEFLAISGSGFLKRIYPIGINDVDYFYQPSPALVVMTKQFSLLNANYHYLSVLNQFWELTTRLDGWQGGQPPDRLLGWVPEEAESNTCGLADARFTETGRRGRVAAVLAKPYCELNCDGKSVALPHRVVAVHELGHLLNAQGLQHAPCCVKEGHPDPSYPFPGGAIGAWGIDLLTPNPLLSPDQTYDFMGYCMPSWVSPYHYNKLAQGFSPVAMQEAVALSVPEPQLLVSGIVYTPALTVTFGTFYPLTSTVPPESSNGTAYCLELRSGAETLLDSRCFDLIFVNPETGEPTGAEAFTFVLPYPDGTESLVLTHQGTDLGRVAATIHAPTVRLVSPNGGERWDATGTYTVAWIASDPDDDPLRYLVLYSPDGGTKWMPIALDLTTSYLEVDCGRLPGSDGALFKVEATDQMHAAEDASDGALTVGLKGPQVYILGPEGDVTITPGTLLWLEGYAYDLEDGTLDQAALHWSSSRDGDLGMGSQILAVLSPGRHVVALTATDSDGSAAMSSINVFVGYRIHLPLALRSYVTP